VPSFVIEEWNARHPRWLELVDYISAQNLAHGVLDEDGDVPSRCLLVAIQDHKLVGFLMFLVQPIGPEMDCPVLQDRRGQPLTEAKIRAFFVTAAYRDQGIGTALQREVLRCAADLGCYQVRSRSAYSRQANYAIKLKLGFAAHPAIRHTQSGDEVGVYWIKHVGATNRRSRAIPTPRAPRRTT
jgi:GNAT superfamily N-acetyltransferase